jgi:TolB protein
MKYIKIIFFITFSLHFVACEEDRIEPTLFGLVRGTVVDDATGKPISGAAVTTTPVSEVLATDSVGGFFFQKVEAGAVIVRGAFLGYVTDTESINVSEGDTATIVIKLRVAVSGNDVPTAAQNLLPADLSKDLKTDSLTLKWRKATDPNKNDKLAYTVILFRAGQANDTIAKEINDTSFVLRNLAYNTNYSWQVIVQDSSKTPVFGQVWQFSTRKVPNNPILFARQTNGNYHIWSCDADGKDQVQLTTETNNQWRPRRNPQRTRIAFLSDQGIQTNLYTMANDGTDVQQVSTFPVSGTNDLELDFTWIKNGGALLFMSNKNLYSLSPDGSGLTLFATAPPGFTYAEVDWNATTNHVLARLVGTQSYQSQFIRYSNVGFLLATELMDQLGAESGPDLSLVGDKYLYTRDLSGFESADGRQLDAQLLIRNTGSAVESNISNTKTAGTNDLDARFSANGGLVIFVNSDNTGTTIHQICTVNLQGLQRKVLVINGEMPDWQ